MNFEMLSAIVASVFGSQVLSTGIQAFFNRKKTGAESAQILMNTMLDWAGKLNTRIDKLEAENSELRKLIDDKDNIISELKVRIAHLENDKVDK